MAYAFIARDFDPDGSYDTIMAPSALTKQSYFAEDECGELTREQFEQLVRPRMTDHERRWWEREGFVHHLGSERFRLAL